MRLAILATLVALAFAGCGSNEASTTTAASPAPSTTAETASSDPTPEAAKPATKPKKSVDLDAKATRALKKDAKAYYGTAPWYDSITKITVKDGNAEIETSIYPDGDADGPGNALCLLIAGPSSDPPRGVESGRVLASDGSTIKRCG
ncbi:MAG: hypothetical protein HYX29_01315 [Solirubrobacterales bacterium]|nr:hypothetical protein [Solirubrobacterales bacterium]